MLSQVTGDDGYRTSFAPSAVRAASVRAVHACLGVLLPVRCGGCGAAGEVVCGDCRRRVLRGPLVHRVLYDGTAVVASAPWRGPARSLVVQAKERGRADLLPVLGSGLARAAACAGWAPGRTAARLLLVPPPAGLVGVLRRGARPTSDLARAAAAQLRRAGADVRCAELLRRAAPVRDQAGLGAGQRHDNVRGAFRATGAVAARLRDGGAVQLLVVDDVCTSGATVLECARALRAEALDVLGAATVALH